MPSDATDAGLALLIAQTALVVLRDQKPADGHAEDNTYGLPQGDGLAAELRRWFEAQQAFVLAQVPADPDVAPLPSHLPPMTGWDDAMAEGCVPYLAPAWDEGGKALMARLGLDPDRFSVTSPHLKSAVEKLALDFCHATNRTTTRRLDDALADLRRQLVEGLVEHGETPGLLKDRVKAVFAAASEGRAARIAVTESSRAYHAGQEAAAVESGAVAGFDLLLSADACPLCRKVHAEAKRVRLGQPFAVVGHNPTYSQIRFPPLHPVCQCSMVEVLAPEFGGPENPDFRPTVNQPEP